MPDDREGPDLEGQLEGCSDRFGKQEAQLEKLSAQMGAVEGSESKPREGALSKVGDKARELSRSCATRRSDIQKHLGSARDLVVRAVAGADLSRANQALEECNDRLDDFATDLKQFEFAIKRYKEDVAATFEKEQKQAAARTQQLEIDRAFAAATKQLVRVTAGSELPTPKARLVQGKSANDLSVEVTIVDPDSGAAEDPLPESASAGILERLPGLYTEAFRSCPSISLLRVVVTCPRLDELGHDKLLEIDAYKAKRAAWAKLCTGKFSDAPEKQLSEIREPRHVVREVASSEWGHIGLICLIAFFFVAVGVLVTARVMTR